MPAVIRIHEYGGSDKLAHEDIASPAPGPGEALIRQDFIGVNFRDIYQRTGLYPLPALPGVIGGEGAGTVEAVGTGVTDVKPGDRAAYAAPEPGGYATYRTIAASRLVPLPEWLDNKTAAAVMVQGMTAEYLLFGAYQALAGQSILVHAAAGGVGQLLCQWASHLGLAVIGTVGSDAKAEIARARGCVHVINYARENFTDAVRAFTNGEGVHAVYDAVGAATFNGSLACLRPRGTLISFGQASGPVAPFDILKLSGGSLHLTRPSLFSYTATRAELLQRAANLFMVLKNGSVKLAPPAEFPFAAAAAAHDALEGRKTTGKILLAV
ncbi:MAG: zinc-binding dehydrogenase [Alphaproteobacteria bacterium]|nr:zinc-binding dehydrogenase [Alphaproteobacteria bacterium]